MMRRALVIATVAALAVARPETYKEKEDFQYSRSSSDEGSKSGFYGAQRGNMGGNYERAHNMDSLAQHQMGGLVRTVDGELGDGAKQKSGSVFSAANSRGVYGSGKYDLSSVEGRNFQEGTSFGDSQAQSSLSSQQASYGRQSQLYSSAANRAQSENSRYTGNSNQALSANNMQSVNNLQSASQYDRTQSSLGSGYSQSGYQEQSIYDQEAASRQSSNAYGTSGTRGSHYRLVGASPVRVYVRPGSTVTIPVAAQSYDASQGSSSIYGQNSQSSGSTLNQNSINSETEVLDTDQQSANKLTNAAKHYESSYSYRKEWEKHDTATNAPLSMPTLNLYPYNSELHEDTQALGSEQREAIAQAARNVQSSSQYTGYNTKSASSRHQAAYNSRAQQQSSSSDAAAASSLASSSSNNRAAYDDAASANLNSANLNSQVENFGSKPKSYQSSYSYHKSWERQGDPYIIKPSTNGIYTAADSQASQKLTSSSLNQASDYSSQRHGSQYRQGQQGYSYDPDRDCDENGHIRVARSPNLSHDRSSYQQSQNTHEGQEYVSQQSQNLEDLGQQSQNLENLGQQSQNLEDFGQQSQNLQDFGQQSQNLEDLGQQSQNLEDLGQQSQNLDNLGQQSQNLEDFGQQSQNLDTLGQQSQNLEDFGQQSELKDLIREAQDAVQVTQNFDRIEDLGQQTQNQWDQQSQTDAGQQTQNTWSTLDITHSHSNRDKEQSSGLEHTGFNHRETQGSVSEINHPSPNQPESHTTPDKPNPFAQTTFDEHRPDQEKTELDTEKEFPQLDLGRQPGQQAQFYPLWEPSPSNVNQNNRDVSGVHQEVPDWQSHHIQLNTGYSHNQHHHHQSTYGTNSGIYQTSYNFNPNTSPEYVNPGYAKPVMFPSTYDDNLNTQYPGNINTGFSSNAWVFPPPLSSSHNHNTNLQSPENVNVFTNTQTYNSLSNHTYSTSNLNLTQESGSTSLTNLWDLIDDIEKQTMSEKETENSNHTYQENTENVEHNSNLDLTQNFNENSFSNEDKVQHSIAPLPSTNEPNVHTTTTKQDNLRPHDAERGDIEPEKQKPQEEAGRGDIGPEDNVELNAPNKPIEILGRPNKPVVYKTPENLETLSLTKEINLHSIDVEKHNNLEQDDKQLESELSVLSLDDQKKLKHHSELDNKKLHNDIQRTTTPKSRYHNEHPHFNIEEESQQNTDQQQGQSNIDQQSYNQFENFDQQNVNLDQQNTHQLADFGQQGEKQEHNMDQQTVNLDQQNIDHHESTFEHGPDEIQQNTDQQFETQGQQTEDLNQQSFSQFEDLGHQTENLGQKHQQSDTFGQQSEGFQQESLGEFGQQSENLGQEHQQSDTFGQQSEGFQQESLGDFGQQSENLGQEHQQSDTFGQQSEGFQQESLGDFGQQSENLGQEHQQSDTFGQQSEGFQQESLGDFGRREHLQQESHSNFDSQSEHLNHPQKDQQLENWGQENDDQQRQNQSEDQWKPNSKPHTSQVEAFVPSAYKESRAPPHSEPVVEPEFVTQKTNNVDTPPEPVTEKVGFWNKVGSKLTGAKDKVKSWFSSS